MGEGPYECRAIVGKPLTVLRVGHKNGQAGLGWAKQGSFASVFSNRLK